MIPDRDLSYCTHFHHGIDNIDYLLAVQKIEGRDRILSEKMTTVEG